MNNNGIIRDLIDEALEILQRIKIDYKEIYNHIPRLKYRIRFLYMKKKKKKLQQSYHRNI